MPCGTTCPIKLVSLCRCSLANDIILEFTVPSATVKWQVVEADALEFRNVRDNSLCTMTYTVPKRLFINKETHCLHPVSSRNEDFVWCLQASVTLS